MTQTPMSYEDFLASKAIRVPERGMATVPGLNKLLRDYQRDVTAFGLRAGSWLCALDTGLGKTGCMLEWAHQVCLETKKPTLVLAPLAVGPQHVAEAEKFGIDAVISRGERVDTAIPVVVNYERIHLLDSSWFGGIALDEGSIIKSFTGATTRKLMEFAADMRWKSVFTATPAPNDHMELGQYSQFLGIMPSNEMLSRWFIADHTNMGRYRLKRHGVNDFWAWVASWSRCMSKPSDLGYSDDGFDLPPLEIVEHIVDTDLTIDRGYDGDQYRLMRVADTSATAIHKEKRITVADRAAEIARCVSAEPNEPWVIWCDTDYEADVLMSMIPQAVEVRGSMKPEVKEKKLNDFTTGLVKVLITKPRIAGFGLNWQHCARVAFVGLSFSYEQFYQAVRRCWRFGQKRTVYCHIAMAETEKAIATAIKRKQGDHNVMKSAMVRAMNQAHRGSTVRNAYNPTKAAKLPAWIGA